MWLLWVASGAIALALAFTGRSAQRFGASLRGKAAEQREAEEPRWRDMSSGQRIFFVVALVLLIGVYYLKFRRVN